MQPAVAPPAAAYQQQPVMSAASQPSTKLESAARAPVGWLSVVVTVCVFISIFVGIFGSQWLTAEESETVEVFGISTTITAEVNYGLNTGEAIACSGDECESTTFDWSENHTQCEDGLDDLEDTRLFTKEHMKDIETVLKINELHD